MKIEYGLARPDAFGGANFAPKDHSQPVAVAGSFLCDLFKIGTAVLYLTNAKGVDANWQLVTFHERELLTIKTPLWVADRWDQRVSE